MYELRGKSLLIAVSAVSSLGFLLIGYDNGLYGGIVNNRAFNISFNNPNAAMVGLIVAIYEIGCFLGCVATAIWGETLGRWKTIGIGGVIMILGALLQASSFNRVQMIIARIISGVGMGFINSTAPVLQAEFSPRLTRGIFFCLQLSTLNFGIFLVYWIDYAFSFSDLSYAWRVPVMLQCVFILAMLFLLCLIPESPRWLAAHGKSDECLQVLSRLGNNEAYPVAIHRLHEEIMHTVNYEKVLGAKSWKDMLKKDRIKSQRRLAIACGIQSFQQLGGINAIIFYSGTLFEKSLGFGSRTAAFMAGALQTWFFLASFIPWVLIDWVGRRPLFLSMITVMAIAMAVQAGLVYQIEHKTSIAHASGIAAAAVLFIFEGAFTVGFQATVWVYPSEILPLWFRQKGSSISTGCNWLFNFMVVQITPIAINNIGWRTYIIFATLNSLWVPIIYFFFPETKGLELEAVDRLFSGDVVVNHLDMGMGSGAPIIRNRIIPAQPNRRLSV